MKIQPKTQKACIHCGKMFYPSYGARMCSDECRKAQKRTKERNMRHCCVCAATFQPVPGKDDQKTCGDPGCVEIYGKRTKRKTAKRKPAPVKRFLKPGIIPQTEGWGDGEIIPVHVENGGKAKLKCSPSSLPKPPRSATKDVRILPPPLPGTYTRIIGNQHPPSPWERVSNV